MHKLLASDTKLNPDLQAWRRYQSYMDAELQQRAVEYGGLATRPAVAKQNVLPMPHWEKRKSLLLRRLADKQVPCVAVDLDGERPT